MLTGSPTYLEDSGRASREEQMLCLLTITGDMPEPIRLVSDVIPVTSRGHEYLAFPFAWAKPSRGETMSPGRLTVQNIDKRIGEIVLAARGVLTCALENIIRSEPDTVIAWARHLKLRNAVVTGTDAQFTLSPRTYETSAWPGIRATPAITPGLWA